MGPVGMESSEELEHRELDLITNRLARDFAAVATMPQIKALVDDAVADLADARVRRFVPVLVEHRVNDELRSA